MIRQPIVTVMGHVDHGKTLLLDAIRGTAIGAKEAGGITQAIGASIIPLPTIKEVCGNLLEQLKLSLTIPGLLFIDTPGHAAFVNLRSRGGRLADIAILVIDINEGLKPQTKESIEILKTYKTPFIIAANKVDLIDGWQHKSNRILTNINNQRPDVITRFETKLYDVVAQVYELGISADRFDRVSDYTKTIAVVPISAKTREGIPELLMLLTGLAQRYLEANLHITEDGPAMGTILEVKEQKGLGTALDVIIYDGSLCVNDPILIGTLGEPVQTKIKALFQPAPHAEMREKRSAFEPVKKVVAATGVRIVAPNTEHVIAGMPIMSAHGNIESLKEEIKTDVQDALLETDADGIIIKADALGSLEALATLLREHGIPVKKSSIGPITKKDISDAEALAQKDPLHGIILGFNIPKPDFSTNAHIFVSDVIYKLIENYQQWKEAQKKNLETQHLKELVQPCKIELLKGYIFRQNNPAICGAEILAGSLTARTPLMNLDGKELTVVKGIQLEQKNVDVAERGKQVAVSLPGVSVGRQIFEGDILYSSISEEEFREYKDYRDHLTPEQKQLLKEIADIKRKHNPVWGI